MTLVMRPRTWGQMADSMETCANGCRVQSPGSGMYRAGTHEALILGRHAAFLCEPCARVWQQAWMGAGGSRVTVRKPSGVNAHATDDAFEVAA